MGLTEFEINNDLINEIIKKALNEDISTGDLSTNLIMPQLVEAKAKFVAKDDGVVAGLDVAHKVFQQLDADIIWEPQKSDGDKVKKSEVLVEFQGSYRAILSGERTALNFIQRMSGIATKTAKYVEAVAHTKAEILDTRKTVPGLRMLDKYAVKMGGGTNHRIGLFDMVMLKENHIRIAGGITKAVNEVRKSVTPNIKIEVETTNLDEVKEAAEAGVDIIMLDNMDNEMMKEAIKLINGRAKVEASGSMDLSRIKIIAELGVDYISVGKLTHSVEAFDISQLVIE